jgi:succinyl-CoA synthetase beta subunit
MARAPLTEWKAKKILLGERYTGMQCTSEKRLPRLSKKKNYVVKVDQGIKQRMKKGLVRVDCTEYEVLHSLAQWKQLGYTSFLIEEMVPHAADAEQYIALERVRDGIKATHSTHGGISVEDAKHALKRALIVNASDCVKVARDFKVPESLIHALYAPIASGSVSYIEINPCIVIGDEWTPLDAAMLVDTTTSDTLLWNPEDIPRAREVHPEESRVAALQQTTAASLKLTVLNRNGALFFLLSGGGGSLVVMDTIAVNGDAECIGNYGEYSGNPTRQETLLYAREVLQLLIASRAKRKVLVIAGGIANFTDIRDTFTGILQALTEVAKQLVRQHIHIIVRRGGPHEAEGLRMMKTFLKEQGISASVYGSEVSLTHAATEACTYIHKRT